MRLRVLLAIAASAVLLTSCGSSDSGPDGREGSPPTTSDLDGNTYTSVEVTGHKLVADSQITLTFSDGTLGVNAGCNTMSSGYDVTDGTLKWSGPAAATQMACSDELMAQDAWLTGLFTDGVGADLQDKTLTLSGPDNETIVLETD